MSKIERIWRLIGISSVIFYGTYPQTIAAQPLEEQHISKNASTVAFTSLSRQVSSLEPSHQLSINLQKNQKDNFQAINRKVNSLLSQATPETETPTEEVPTEIVPTEELSPLEQLNPNADSLSIPSTPEEVTIDLSQPITLEQAIELALRNNKDLKEAELNLERSQKELREARAALYPSLALNGNVTNSDTASNNRQEELFSASGGSSIDSTTGESTTSFNGDLTLNYDIFNGGERGADIRRAKKQVEFGELDLARVTEQTTFEAKRDYYALQDADSQVEIEQGAVEDASQTLKDAELLEQAGLGTRFDVLRAEVELANAQQRLISAKAAQNNARRQLVETLSLGEQVDLETADEITKTGTWDFSLEESIIAAYNNRVELEQFLVNREISKEQRAIALAAVRPRISVFGQLDALDITDDDVDLTTGYTLGAQLQWTLFDGGAAGARAKQEDVDVALADNGFANQKNIVRLEVEQAFYNQQANEQNIGTAEKAVTLADESLRLARLRFQAGVGTQTDVIEAQTELTTARGNLLRAIIDYNQSFNELQRAITGEPEGE